MVENNINVESPDPSLAASNVCGRQGSSIIGSLVKHGKLFLLLIDVERDCTDMLKNS